MKIGIIGKGFVGNAVYHGLNLHNEVNTYDLNKSKSSMTFSNIVKWSEIIFICVPTPSNSKGIQLDILDLVIEDIHQIKRKKPPVIVIKSTVIPGTTDNYIDKYGAHIMCSPEFLTERTALEDFKNPSRIIIGCKDSKTSDVFEDTIWEIFKFTPLVFCTPIEAELIKYMSNCFFAMKISFFNEMHAISEKIDCNWQTVLYGIMLSGKISSSHIDVPGHDGKLGYGGSCFPKDMKALIEFAESISTPINTLKGAEKTNRIVRNE